MIEKSREKAIPKYKLERVKELVELMKNNKTIMITSIKNIPGSQFQEIKNKLKDKAKIKVLKKSLMLRALDEAELEKLKKYIHEDIALLFSQEDAFDLASMLSESQSPAKAKPGQLALNDIVVHAGPTDLMPGPAISELGSLGLKVKVEDGKIAIQEDKVIVKQGEKISEQAAGIMDKLNILPFKVGFIPEAAYDKINKEVYLDIVIDKEATLNELKEAASKAFGFAIKIGYICKDTIGFLLRKASVEGECLSKLIKEKEEKAKEDQTQQNKDTQEEK